jgi:hypothetical protein
MDTDEKRSPFEQQVATALRAAPPQRTPDCFEPDDLLLLIDQGEADPACAPMLGHIATCAYCRREYVQMRRSLLEAETLLAAQPAASPETTISGVPAKPTWWQGWRQRFLAFPAPGYALAVVTVALALTCGVSIRSAQITNNRLRAENRALIARLNQPQPPVSAPPSQASNGELQAQLRANVLALERAEQEKASTEQQNQALLQKLAAERQEAARALAQQKLLARNGTLLSPQDVTAISPPAAQIASLSQKQILQGPGNDQPSVPLLSPVATQVQEDRPRLRWEPIQGATSYRVSLVACHEIHNLLVPDAPVGKPMEVYGTEYAVPRSLRPGTTYEWQVSALKAGEAQPSAVSSARFRVLEPSKAARLSTLRLKLADLYAKAGLREDALAQLQAISSADPHYAAAQQRIQQIRAQQHLR